MSWSFVVEESRMMNEIETINFTRRMKAKVTDSEYTAIPKGSVRMTV